MKLLPNLPVTPKPQGDRLTFSDLEVGDVFSVLGRSDEDYELPSEHEVLMVTFEVTEIDQKLTRGKSTKPHRVVVSNAIRLYGNESSSGEVILIKSDTWIKLYDDAGLVLGEGREHEI